jgi:hypothetical protein
MRHRIPTFAMLLALHRRLADFAQTIRVNPL